jgi:acylphosphatase
MGDNLIRKNVTISGHVQGVCFRDGARSIAKELGLFGYVKNISNGKVEIIVEGQENEVNKFLEWCHKGPRNARVENIKVINDEYIGDFIDFKIMY